MADLLGIECGATRTVALFEQANEVQRAVFGPANLRLLSDRQLAAHLRKIAKAIDLPDAVTIGMAGARTTADKKRLLKAAVKVWPKASHIHATNDLETALAADTQRKPLDRVLVLSGTGSCCFGQAPDGTTAKLGGWGHILGDKGSGYEIGLRALKACVFYLDRDGTWSALGQRILRRLQLNSPDQLIDWVAGAAKPEIADLAREVFAAHSQARQDLDRHSRRSRQHAGQGRLRLCPETRRQNQAGSIPPRRQRAAKAAQVCCQSGKGHPLPAFRFAGGSVENESATGALELARHLAKRPSSDKVTTPLGQAPAIPVPELAQLGQAPTEQRHPRSMNLTDCRLARRSTCSSTRTAGYPLPSRLRKPGCSA